MTSDHVPILFEHHQDRPLFDQLDRDEVDMVFAYDEAHALEERGWFSARLFKRHLLPSLIATIHLLIARKSA